MTTATASKVVSLREQVTEVAQVTPAMAAKWLKSNTQNRPMSESTVEALSQEMKAGRWRLHHQGVAIDWNGVLRDGQHRLAAIVLSKCTVPMLVTRDVDPAVFDVIDGQRPRSIGDQLTLVHKIHAGKRIAPAAVILRNLENSRLSGRRMSVGLTLEYYERFKAGLDFACAAIGSGPFAKAPILGALAFGYEADPEKAKIFAEQVRTGERLVRMDPAMALRNFVINQDGNSSQLDRKTFTLVALRCFYGFHKNEHFGVIKPNAILGSETINEAMRFFRKFHGKKVEKTE